MFEFLHRKKVMSGRLDRSVEEIVEAQAKRKELELENQRLQMDLENTKRRKERDLDEATIKFNREKEEWKHDKAKMTREFDEDKRRYNKQLADDFAMKEREAISLLKLDSEQKAKQLELNYQRLIQEKEAANVLEITRLKSDHANDKMEFQTKTIQEHYEKLSKALNALHTEGNVNTKFVQELALKMLEKPLGVNVHENRVLLTSKGETLIDS